MLLGLDLHFLSFWPCGPSFPCILALWAFISFHFGLFGVSVWAPPTSCQKLPVCPTSLQWIYQRRDRPHFAVFSILGLHFLAFWPCGPSFACILALWAFISLHFGLVGFHFLAFWPCGPSFPCILALWAFISLHFGLVGLHFLSFWPFPFILLLVASFWGPPPQVGLHFLSFWPFRGQLLCPPPQVAKNGPFAQRPYNGFISAVTGPILQFLAFCAFISLHFGLVGFHFLAFWPCGPSFPCILALWAFISLHFGLVGLHFLAFWPCGPSFPCILALWAFISLHFGLVGLHFLSFWPFRGRLLGFPPTSCQKWPVCPTSSQWIYRRRDRLHFAVFSILGLHFLAFWPCGPSFPCILALWAFSSLHFGLVGLHFLAFWPCGLSFPCILALWAFISFHFGIFGVSVWGPPHKLPKMARLPNVLTMDLSAP